MTTENQTAPATVAQTENMTYRDLPVPATYRGRAESWDTGKSSQKGTLECAITFRLVVRPARVNADGKAVPEQTVRMIKRLYFTETTYARAIESLDAMGFTGKKFSELANNGGDLNANDVELVCRMGEPYDGGGDPTKARDAEPEIAFINKIGGIALTTPLEGDEVSVADAQFEKMAEMARSSRYGRSGRAASGKPAGAAPVANGGTAGLKVDLKDDTTIPF